MSSSEDEELSEVEESELDEIENEEEEEEEDEEDDEEEEEEDEEDSALFPDSTESSEIVSVEGEDEGDEDEGDEDEDEDEDEDDHEGDEDEDVPIAVATLPSPKVEKPPSKIDNLPPKTVQTTKKSLTIKPLKRVAAVTQPTPKVTRETKVVVQPVSPQEVKEALSPKPGPKTPQPEPVEIPSQLVEEGKRMKPRKGVGQAQHLDALLVKSSNESDDFFLLRSQYARAAQKAFPEQDATTHMVLGYYGANHIQLGMVYPQQIQQVLNYINEELSSQ